ncbi:hypothetical protein ACFFRR_008311 [Megaselia abdita]
MMYSLPSLFVQNKVSGGSHQTLVIKMERPRHMQDLLDRKRPSDIIRYSRDSLRKVVGFITVNKHMKYMGVLDNDDCKFCEDFCAMDDIPHLLCECEALSNRRFRILGNPFPGEDDLPYLYLYLL